MAKKEQTLTKSGDFALVSVADDMDRLNDLMQDVIGPGGLDPRDLESISMPQGDTPAWTINTVDGKEVVPHLDVIIVASGPEGRRYYERDLSVSSKAPPDCTSVDGITGVGNPGGDCSACPLSAYGEGCKKRQVVYLLFPDSIMPVALTLSQQSIKPFRKYTIGMVGRFQNPRDFITRIGLKEEKSQDGVTYYAATFENLGPIEKEHLPIFQKFSETMKPALMLAPPTASADPSNDNSARKDGETSAAGASNESAKQETATDGGEVADVIN